MPRPSVNQTEKTRSQRDYSPRWLSTRVTSFAAALALLTLPFLALLLLLAVENPLYVLLIVAAAVAVGLSISMLPVREPINCVLHDDPTATAMAVLVLALAYPFFWLDNPYWIYIGVVAGLYVMMSLGLNVHIGETGMVNLGYAAFFAMGAYASALLMVNWDLSYWVTIPLAIMFAVAAGIIIGLPTLRTSGDYLVLVTLGAGEIVHLLLVNLRLLTGGTDGVIGIPPPKLFGHSFSQGVSVFGAKVPQQLNYYYLVLVLVILAYYLSRRMKQSWFGQSLEAIRDDEVAAGCCGIRTPVVKLVAFALGAVFGGVAGSVYATMTGYIGPEDFVFSKSITLVSMLIVGGMGNIAGVVIGALLLIIIPEKLREFADYRMLLYGVILVLMMRYRPQGLIPRRMFKPSVRVAER